MMKHIAVGSILLAMAGVSPAMADDDCHVPMDKWQPREAVQKMAETQGWKVGRIKIDDGCYQIKGVDKTGKAFKAKIDPATLSIVKMKHKDKDKDHDHDKDDDKHDTHKKQSSSQPDMSGTSSEQSSNKLLEAGKLPSGVTK